MNRMSHERHDNQSVLRNALRVSRKIATGLNVDRNPVVCIAEPVQTWRLSLKCVYVCVFDRNN